MITNAGWFLLGCGTGTLLTFFGILAWAKIMPKHIKEQALQRGIEKREKKKNGP